MDDLVRGITGLLFLDSDKTVEQRTDRKFLVTQHQDTDTSSMHDPVNIGNPRELTVLEIAKLILDLTRSSSRITHNPLPADDPKVRRPDISRARLILKWEPKVELEDALRLTIEYFRKIV